jgi:hypothetical protein
MSKNSSAQVVRDPAMSTPEFYNYLIQTIKQTATLQPVNECKEVHSVVFITNGTGSILESSNTLTVPFAVKRVKYSIIARQSDNAHDTSNLYLLHSSLNNSMIGCISNDHNDITETQTHEFIYQSPREFQNERIILKLNEGFATRLNPVDFIGVIVLILELSNY